MYVNISISISIFYFFLGCTIKSTVNIQIIRGLLQYYSIVQNKLKNFYLTMNKQSKIFYINY